MRVTRPVVRSYTWRYREQAAAWVRRGGHAVVWRQPRRARLVFARPRAGDDLDLGWWAVLDLGRSDYSVARSGPFAKMGFVRVPHDCYSIVRARVLRDSIHPEPTRDLDLDCLECGACCRDNRVELCDRDIERFASAGRPDLSRPPYARRRDGTLVLSLRGDRGCRHLGDDNKCAIYRIRPDACSTFPPGSECCLSSREEELAVIDGATA